MNLKKNASLVYFFHANPENFCSAELIIPQ